MRTDILYSEIEKRILGVNSRESVYAFMHGVLYALPVFLLLGFLFISAEAVFGFNAGVRTVFYWAYVLSIAATLTYLVIGLLLRGFFRKINLISYAAKIGGYFPLINDRISNALSLYKSYTNGNYRNSYFSAELVNANLFQVSDEVKNADLAGFIDYKKLRKPLYYFLVIAAVTSICFAVFREPLSAALYRAANYNYNFITNDYGIEFEITPGDYETFSGDSAAVTIRVKTNKPGLEKSFAVDKIDFITREFTKDGVEISVNSRTLKSNPDGSFQAVIGNINNTVFYHAEYKGISSKEYKITLAEYPILKGFSVTIVYPEYTGLPQKKLSDNDGEITCAEGSVVNFTLKSSKVLSSAGIVFAGTSYDFAVDGEQASGSVKADKEGTYKIFLKDSEGRLNRNGKEYSIRIIKNEPPRIAIIEPEESNFNVYGIKDLLVRARITDDYGFSRLALGYRKVFANSIASAKFSVLAVPIKNPNATSLEVPYIWELTPLGLKSGSMVEYYMEVTDNTGNVTRSDIRTLTYNSLSDLLKKSGKTTKDLEKDLKSILDDVKNLNEKLREANKNTEELAVNEQKRKDLQNQVENVQKNMDAVQQKLEQGVNEMQKNNSLSDKTLEQFMKLQELFQKINTPEFREMLKKLQDALKKNNPDQLRQELNNIKFDEEAFKKQLEQVMELMKKIENLQKFGELTKLLDDITKAQEELKRQTENTKPEETGKMNSLADKQKTLQEELEKYKEELNKLIDKMKQMKDDNNPQSLKDISKKLQEKSTDKKMQKSSSDLFKGQKEQSEKTQQDILDDLNEMNEDMQNALEKEMSNMDMNNKMMDKMKKIKQNLEELSKDQKELMDDTRELKKNEKTDFEKMSKEERELQQRLTAEIEDLMNMTKSGVQISPEMGKELGNAYNKMDKASDNLTKGEKDGALSDQGKAKESLDKAAKMLGDMLDQMGKQQGKGKQPGQGKMGQLMQKLAQMIGQQQGVTGQMNKMGENGKSGKDGKGGQEELSQEQRLQMDKLKLEQEQIRKSLDELTREFEKEQERSGEKLLGDLKEVQKDMQESIKQMGEYNMDNNLLERQNRILSRMLDAQLAQREKDFEQKRESKPGDNYVRKSPPEIILSGPRSIDAIKEDILRLQKEGFTEDYEALIMKYLSEIKKSGN